MTGEQDRRTGTQTGIQGGGPATPDNGMIHVRSAYGVTATLDRLEAEARAGGLKIFARIEQASEAARVGLTLRPTQLLLFGSPRAGTLLMQASFSVALDLPLHALAWEDADGQAWVTYDDPAYLGTRHGLSPELLRPIEGIHALVGAAARGGGT